MTHSAPDRAVIFDLGGVLVDVQSDQTPRQWAAACGADPAAAAEVFWADTDYHRLERGEITLADYHQIIAPRLGGTITYEQFAFGWVNIFGDVLDGMGSLVDRLAGQVRLVCLSNTNAVHVDAWRPMYAELLSSFERVFVSNEMGSRKPEPACYRQVLDYLALEAEQAIFVDDRPENVRAAEDLGVRGIVAVDAAQIEADLRGFGVEA